MKLDFLSFDFEKFASEMQNLKGEDACQEPGLW